MAIDAYTLEEVQAAFYGPSDFLEFKQDVKRTIHMIENNQIIDEIELSTRGVEGSWTTKASRRRRRNRVTAIADVLLQQESQFSCWPQQQEQPQEDQQEEEENTIASVYASASRQCVASAYIVGLSDAEIANKVFEEERMIPDGEAKIQLSVLRGRGGKEGGQPRVDQSKHASQRELLPSCQKQEKFCVRRQICNSAAA
jgi:hypothetical protein